MAWRKRAYKKKPHAGGKRRYWRKKRSPTYTGAGVGRGYMGDKPMELVINRGLGFPARFRTKLRYNENVALSSTAGSLNAYTFFANGLYDPNDTGTGHQPMFFDQYMAVYNHYKVLGAICNVKIAGPAGSSTPNANTRMALIVNDDNSISGVTQFSTLVEWGQLNDYKLYGSFYSQQKNASLTAKWSCKRWFKDKYLDKDLSGNSSSNPAETACFIIVQQPVGSDDATNHYIVTIDYIVDFYEIKDVSPS